MLRNLIILVSILAIVASVLVFLPESKDFVLEKLNIKAAEEPNEEHIFTENEEYVAEEIENLTFDEFMKRGEGYFNNGFLTLAINNFSAAAAMEPESRLARLKLTESMIILRDFSLAEATAREALKDFPNDKEITLLLGNALIQKSNFSEAKKIFQNMPDDSPEKFFFLGVILSYEGKDEEAKKNLEIAINSSARSKAEIILGAYKEFDLFPNGNELHKRLLLAKAFNQLGLFEMAIYTTKNIAKENPIYRDAWIIMGHSYLSLEKYDFALSTLEKALELDPTKPETVFFLGLVSAEMKNYTEAIEYMNRAILNGYEPKIDALKKLGDFYADIEDYDKSVKYYESALNENDNDIGAFVRPVWFLIEHLKNPQKAEQIAKWAIEKHPNSAMAYNLLAWAETENSKFSLAEKHLLQAIKMDENLSAAYLNFGKLREKEGKKIEALEFYKKAYDMDSYSSIGESAAANYNRLLEME